MAVDLPLSVIDAPVELGELLAHTLGAVAYAQSHLDEATARRVEAYRETPAGQFAVPPLWHVFTEVQVEVALSASVRRLQQTGGGVEPRLMSRTVNPAMVGLYGYQASAGLTVRVTMAPRATPDEPETTT